MERYSLVYGRSEDPGQHFGLCKALQIDLSWAQGSSAHGGTTLVNGREVDVVRIKECNAVLHNSGTIYVHASMRYVRISDGFYVVFYLLIK